MSKIWRPFTQEKTSPKSIKAVAARGSYVFDESGKKYLDLISSWWVTLHGHGNEKIASAIYEQAQKMEHVMFTKFSHDPANKICEQLSGVLHEKLCNFFFSDNGSTAVEVALKMSYQYWINRGVCGKSKFVSFSGGYHGDTFGCMGVTDGYHNVFSELCFESFRIPWPCTWIGDDDIEEKEKAAIDEYKKCLQANASRIAAIIVEPMMQGASGMRLVRPQFLRQIVELSKDNNVLVIFDEVMTGFFRTGKIFAHEHIDDGQKTDYISDILCLSKGLTGGFLPLSLTVTSQEIFDAFLGDSFATAFVHGHSYTANPISCAAAVASFDILQTDESVDKIANIAATHECWSKELAKSDRISKIRTLGTIAAFEINTPQEKIPSVISKMFERGFFIRPLVGNVIYFLPPYSTTSEELDFAYITLLEII